MWGKRLKNEPDCPFRDREALRNHVTVVEMLKKRCHAQFVIDVTHDVGGC